MTTGRIVLGLIVLGAIVVPPAVAGWRAGRRLQPDSNALAALVASVIALFLVLGVSQLLGTVGLFAIGPLIAGSLVASVAVWALAGRWGPVGADPRGRAAEGLPRWVAFLAAAVGALVAARWAAGSFETLEAGVRDPDSRLYHLTFAADFVKTGSLTGAKPIWPDPVHNFHPLGNETVDALGMLAMGRDVLVPFVNLGWLALLMLAGWCAGIRDRVAPLTLLVVLWVASIPLFVSTNGGNAVNDLAVIACLVAAVALWRNGGDDRRMFFLVGLALGLSLGVKLSAVPFAVALAVAFVLLAPRGRRASFAGALGSALLLAGSFWYLRNLIRTGSPLPALNLPLLPSPPLAIVDRYGHGVAEYLLDGEVWRTVFRPGLREFFGFAAVLWAVACACAAPALRRSRAALALVVCAVVGLLAYLVNPASAWGPEGRPELLLFTVDLRYTLPGLALLGLGCALAAARAGLRVQAAFAVLAAAAVAAQGFPEEQVLAGLVIVAVLALATAALARAPLGSRAKWALAGLGVFVVAAALGPSVTRDYLAKATDNRDPQSRAVMQRLAAEKGARIASFGFDIPYPLYGPGLDNDPEFAGVPGPHGAFGPPSSCEEFVRAVARRRPRYLVVGPPEQYGLKLNVLGWARSQPAARQVVDAPPYYVFRIEGRLDPRRCASVSRRPRPAGS